MPACVINCRRNLDRPNFSSRPIVVLNVERLVKIRCNIRVIRPTNHHTSTSKRYRLSHTQSHSCFESATSNALQTDTSAELTDWHIISIIILLWTWLLEAIYKIQLAELANLYLSFCVLNFKLVLHETPE